MATLGKCGHEICDCSVPPDDEYCSDHCRAAADQDIVELRCDCQHGTCE